jgi:uncharacterized membrane protein YsdA (DUF1294 family)
MDELQSGSLTLWQTAQWIFATYEPLVWMGLVGYLLIINYGAYLIFQDDKDRAIAGDWRWSEAALLNAAFFGGSIGSKVAQKRFRHKTRKEPFRSTLNFICMLQVIVVIAGFGWAFGYLPLIVDWVR